MNKEKNKKKKEILKNNKQSFVWFVVIIGILTLILFRKIVPFNVLVYATDQVTAGYAFREFEAHTLKTLHYFPLWDPFLFSGIPFVDAFHGDIFYITAFLRLIFPTNVVMNWQFIIHTFLAGLFMYIFLGEFNLKKELRMLLSIGYMFSGYSVTLVFSGHDSKVAIFSFTPLILWAVLKGARTLKIHYAFLAGFVMGLGLLAPHVQMMYYLYMTVSFYYLMEIIYLLAKKEFKQSVNLLLQYLVILGVSFGIGAIQLYPGYQYTSTFSPRAAGNRGYDFAVSWSMPWEDYIAAFFARFSNFIDGYWGRAPFKINSEYSGAIALFLLLLSLLSGTFKKNRKALFFSFTFLLFSFMALGGYTPVYKVYYAILPGIKKFRAPSMSFFLVVISIYALGAIALSELEHFSDKLYKKLIYSTGIILGLWFLFLILGEHGKSLIISIFNVPQSKLQALSLSYHYIPLSFLRAGVLIGIFTYTIFKVFRKENALYVAALLGLITYLDLFQIDNIFIKSLPSPKIVYAPDGVVNFLKKDKSVYRVFPLFYRIDENYLMLHGIESIGGHHGNQFQRYQEYVGNPHHFMFRPQEVPYLLKYPYLADLLNVKYVITQPTPRDIEQYRTNPMVYSLLRDVNNFIYDTTHFIPVYVARDYKGQYLILKNRHFVPRIFFVTNYKVIPQKDSVLSYMLSPDFKPYEEIVLEENPDFSPENTPDSTGIIAKPQGSFQFIKREPNHIVVKFNVNKDAFLVYSENYYIRWKAYIDKNPAKIYRADYILRAIPVKKGEHTLELVYASSLYNRLGILSVLLSLLSLGIFIVVEYRVKNM